jgi:hypothetical protein
MKLNPNSSPAEIAFAAQKAETVLRSSRKEVVGEHDERIRKLQTLQETLIARDGDDLFKLAETLTPDLAKLIEAPLWGMD